MLHLGLWKFFFQSSVTVIFYQTLSRNTHLVTLTSFYLENAHITGCYDLSVYTCSPRTEK